MTFGHLVNKWRIFKQPLQVSLKKVGKVFMCGTRLDSFCINEGEADNVLTNDASHDIIETVLAIPAQENLSTIPRNSIMRDIVVEEIARMGLSRPVYNLERNRL